MQSGTDAIQHIHDIMKQSLQLMILIFCCGVTLVLLSVLQNVDYIAFLEYMKEINLTLYEGNRIYVRDTKETSSLCNKDIALGQPILLAKTCKKCEWLSCKNLLFHHDNITYEIIDKIINETRSKNQSNRPSKSMLNMLKDCESFRKTRGYPHLAYSEEELNFPIAFNILVHQDFEQVERLLRAIYFPQNLYCIHVDAKQNRKFKNAIQSLAKCFDNVFVPKKTEIITYAGFSRLQADINCMKESLNKSNYQWKYLLNLAGQSWPLRSNLEMVKILKVYNGSNDIEGIYPMPFRKYRTQTEWKETSILIKEKNTTEQRIVRTSKRNKHPPAGLKLVKGSAYGVFSREFVEWLLSDDLAIELLHWCRKTYSPDEHYWATLHHTSINSQVQTPGGYSGKPNKLMWQSTYVMWGSDHKKLSKAKGCHGYWNHWICVFGTGDLPNLVNKTQFFANKFDIQYDSLALDCMEQWIKYKNTCSIHFDVDFYKKLPFVKNS